MKTVKKSHIQKIAMLKWANVIDNQLDIDLAKRKLTQQDIIGHQLHNERFDIALKLLAELGSHNES